MRNRAIRALANPDVNVEIGTQQRTGVATDLVEPERTSVYAEQMRRQSAFAGFQDVTERVIPVIAIDLDPA